MHLQLHMHIVRLGPVPNRRPVRSMIADEAVFAGRVEFPGVLGGIWLPKC